jgi:hypothetical protein
MKLKCPVLKKDHNQLIRVIFFIGIMLGTICALLAQSEAQPTSQDGKKEIPKITFKNLSPPYEDYDYFQDSKKYVFQFNATSFNFGRKEKALI